MTVGTDQWRDLPGLHDWKSEWQYAISTWLKQWVWFSTLTWHTNERIDCEPDLMTTSDFLLLFLYCANTGLLFF